MPHSVRGHSFSIRQITGGVVTVESHNPTSDGHTFHLNLPGLVDDPTALLEMIALHQDAYEADLAKVAPRNPAHDDDAHYQALQHARLAPGVAALVEPAAAKGG